MYERFIKYDVLEFASGAMTEGTGDSSEAPRSILGPSSSKPLSTSIPAPKIDPAASALEAIAAL